MDMKDIRKSTATMALKMPPLKKEAQRVSFTLFAPGAKEVMLAGNFNNWSSKQTALRKEKNDLWKTEVSLVAGKHEYKFVVDGKWVTDPNNSKKAWNSCGSENSIIEIN